MISETLRDKKLFREICEVEELDPEESLLEDMDELIKMLVCQLRALKVKSDECLEDGEAFVINTFEHWEKHYFSMDDAEYVASVLADALYDIEEKKAKERR